MSKLALFYLMFLSTSCGFSASEQASDYNGSDETGSRVLFTNSTIYETNDFVIPNRPGFRRSQDGLGTEYLFPAKVFGEGLAKFFDSNNPSTDGLEIAQAEKLDFVGPAHFTVKLHMEAGAWFKEGFNYNPIRIFDVVVEYWEGENKKLINESLFGCDLIVYGREDGVVPLNNRDHEFDFSPFSFRNVYAKEDVKGLRIFIRNIYPKSRLLIHGWDEPGLTIRIDREIQ